MHLERACWLIRMRVRYFPDEWPWVEEIRWLTLIWITRTSLHVGVAGDVWIIGIAWSDGVTLLFCI